jgi:hypothetical protein
MKSFVRPMMGMVMFSSFSSSAMAVVVIDNLAAGTQGFAATVSGPVGGGFFAPPPNGQAVFSFVTGMERSYLNSLSVSVNVSNGSQPLVATLSSGPTIPSVAGTIEIGSVAGTVGGPITQTLTFVPGSQLILEAATRYWVHFAVNAGNASYTLNNTNTPVVDPEWTLENTHFRSNSLSPWNELTSGPQARARLDVTVIPEPTAALLGGMGMLVLLRRRR